MLPPEVHSEQKKALMNATVKAVVEKGFENATARTIGALSGVKEVYIYHYFKSKDDLIKQTFDYADCAFLDFILDNFGLMEDNSFDYRTRCEHLFYKCWEYIFEHTDLVVFYVRYYFSSAFLKNSYDEHIARFSVLYEKMRPACHPDADVKLVLHHLLDTLMGQAINQITHPGNFEQVADNTFWLLYNVLKCGKGI